jgi:hypothetical protein
MKTRLAPCALLGALLVLLPACRTAPPPVPADPVPAARPAEAAAVSVPAKRARPREKHVPRQNLFLLRWNPNISSFTEEEFREGLDRLLDGNPAFLDWNLLDWHLVRPGDWALLARVGTDADGIAGILRLTGDVYAAPSWRGDGTTLHYAYGEVRLFQDAAATGLFSAAALEPDFPEIDWHGGHSGPRIPPALAERLALRLADDLAHADPAALPPASFAAASGGETGRRRLVCSFLSDLCPALEAEVLSHARPTPAIGESWLPDDGTPLVYDPGRLAPGIPLAAVVRPISWEGTIRIDAPPAPTPAEIPRGKPAKGI